MWYNVSMKRFIIPIIVVIGLLFLVPTIVRSPSSVAPIKFESNLNFDCGWSDDELLVLINGHRSVPVMIDGDLDKIVDDRVVSLGGKTDFHEGFRTLYNSGVFWDYRAVAENIATIDANCPRAESAIGSWKNSESHWSVLTDSRYDRIGIGFYKGVVVTIYGDLR